jgi:hypothetical protein
VHPQLEAVVRELVAAEDRLRRLAAAVPGSWWTRRADPARWSMAECVAHLNLTAKAFLPLIDAAIAEARAIGGAPPARFRRDPVGWLLWRTAGPPVRHRVRTAAAFIPEALTSEAGLLETFAAYQAEQIEAVRRADGLPLHKVRITSPFNARLRYSLFSCLTVLPPHQHRHLWQAEQVLEQLRRAE